jgi:hypothetical protein
LYFTSNSPVIIYLLFNLSLTLQTLIATNELLRLQDCHWRSLLQQPGPTSTSSVNISVALLQYLVHKLAASTMRQKKYTINEAIDDEEAEVTMKEHL